MSAPATSTPTPAANPLDVPEPFDGQSPVRAIASHYPSHRNLIGTLSLWHRRLGPSPALDAVVVTTCRGAQALRSGLATGARIAEQRSCPMLVLVSGPAGEPAALEAIRRLGPHVTAVNLDPAPNRLPKPQVNDVLGERVGPGARPSMRRLPQWTIGEARNLGLTVARAAGWDRVLFLDDDVRAWTDEESRARGGVLTLDRDGLSAALRAMADGSPTRAVGWTLDEYSDNSVVCRARSLVGDKQDRFVGGGALLVRCDEDVPFFPSIYNEDWMFLLSLIVDRRKSQRGTTFRWARSPLWRPGMASDAVLLAGSVKQDSYIPFPAGRAGREEIGDVLAEGLFGLLHECDEYFASGAAPENHDPFAVGAASKTYWSAVVRERRAMIEDLRVRALALPVTGTGADVADVADRAVAALTEALATHDARLWERSWRRPSDSPPSPDEITLKLLKRYLPTLQEDRRAWKAFLGRNQRAWLIGDLKLPSAWFSSPGAVIGRRLDDARYAVGGSQRGLGARVRVLWGSVGWRVSMSRGSRVISGSG